MKLSDYFAVVGAIDLIDKENFDNEKVKKEISDLIKEKGFDYE